MHIITEDDPAELQLSLFAVTTQECITSTNHEFKGYLCYCHIKIKAYHSNESWPHFS